MTHFGTRGEFTVPKGNLPETGDFVGRTDYATRNSAAGQRFERQVDNAVSPVPTSSVAPKAYE